MQNKTLSSQDTNAADSKKRWLCDEFFHLVAIGKWGGQLNTARVWKVHLPGKGKNFDYSENNSFKGAAPKLSKGMQSYFSSVCGYK